MTLNPKMSRQQIRVFQPNRLLPAHEFRQRLPFNACRLFDRIQRIAVLKRLPQQLGHRRISFSLARHVVTLTVFRFRIQVFSQRRPPQRCGDALMVPSGMADRAVS